MEAEQIAENFFKYIQRADLLMEVARWREALHELNQHLRNYPDDYYALCKTALCHYELKEFQLAYDASKRAIEADPDDEWGYRLQSSIFTENGERKRSLDAAKLCIEKEPESPYAIQCLFWAQANYGALDDAEVTLRSLLELIPGTADAHEAAGFLALERKKFDDAEKHYLEALALDPESVNALNNLGVVYLQLAESGRGLHYKKKSVEMFQRAVKVQPTFKLAQQNISAASTAIKFGAPVGLIFLLWFGLRIVASLANSSFRNDESSIIALTTSSYVLTAANIYFTILLLAIIAAIVAAIFTKYREAIFYSLTTTKTWLFIFGAFALSTFLYIFGFWALGNDSTVFSASAFGFSLIFFLIAGLNALSQWRSRRA